MFKSIIIPVYNQSHYTKQCLSDLSKLDFSDKEIIVINNGSTDNTIDVVNSFINENKCIKLNNLKENYGFAKACNIGYVYSCGEIIIFLNNDIRVLNKGLTSWVEDLEKELEQNTLVGLSGGYLDKDYNFKYETNGDKQWNYVSGWILSAYKEVFQKFSKELNQDGPFIEEFGTYFEDTYMSFMSKKINIDLKIIDLPLKHIGRGTSSKMNLNEIYLQAKQKFINKMKEI